MQRPLTEASSCNMNAPQRQLRSTAATVYGLQTQQKKEQKHVYTASEDAWRRDVLGYLSMSGVAKWLTQSDSRHLQKKKKEEVCIPHRTLFSLSPPCPEC